MVLIFGIDSPCIVEKEKEKKAIGTERNETYTVWREKALGSSIFTAKAYKQGISFKRDFTYLNRFTQ